MTGYAELQVTTNFSFLRGASHVEELFAQAKRLGLAALGIADRNALSWQDRDPATCSDAPPGRRQTG